MAYDSVNKIFQLYSEDYELIGERNLTIFAYLEEYQTVSATLESTIVFRDPCEWPFMISSKAKKIEEPLEYRYTKEGFTYDPQIELDPPFCSISYECISVTENTQGAKSSLQCDSLDALNIETSSGKIQFITNDINKFIQSTYNITMRASSGYVTPISIQYSIEIILVDPCTDNTEIIVPSKIKF